MLKGAKVMLRPPDASDPARALVKAGYRQVGVHREDIWRDGRWHDHWMCEVLRSDREREHPS
ncbi:MAG: hypothetical protein KGJ98_05620 [Chloroflexota bacterium]|nr:hypothetical protein [Chloroflexota bacterium]